MARSPDRRPGFSRRAQTSLFLGYVLAIAGAVVGAVLLVMSRFDPPAFKALRAAASELTVPVSGALGSANRWIAAVPDAIGGWVRLHGENERMRGELAVAPPRRPRGAPERPPGAPAGCAHAGE